MHEQLPWAKSKNVTGNKVTRTKTLEKRATPKARKKKVAPKIITFFFHMLVQMQVGTRQDKGTVFFSREKFKAHSRTRTRKKCFFCAERKKTTEFRVFFLTPMKSLHLLTHSLRRAVFFFWVPEKNTFFTHSLALSVKQKLFREKKRNFGRERKNPSQNSWFFLGFIFFPRTFFFLGQDDGYLPPIIFSV